MDGRQKKRWVLYALLMVLVFIGVFAYLPPYLFKLPFIHEKAETFVARQVNGSFTFREGELTLFPRPRVRLHNILLRNRHGISVTADTVYLYPGLLSLFFGKLDIAGLTAIHPHCTAEIPETGTPYQLPPNLKSLQERLKVHVEKLVTAARRDFSIEIRQGAFVLTSSGKTLFSIREIKSRLLWKFPALSMDIAGKSDIWDESDLSFRIDAARQEGEGRLAVKKFTPRTNADIFLPKSLPRLETAVFDSNIFLRTRNLDNWDISFEILNPDLSFQRENETQIVSGKKAAGQLKIDKASTHLSVTDLDLSSPRLQLTGRLDMETEKPSAGWQVDARDVDISSTREATLFFVGWSKIARGIFDTLLEGGIPRISLGQDAQNLDGFRDVSTLFIRGRLDQATVYVPKSDLLLTGTSGEVSVSNGTLEANGVETRLGKSTGSRGRFTMSLEKRKPTPFYVEADIHADVSALPPLLARLVKNRPFSNEMGRIISAEGTATGKMILDRGSSQLLVTVDVSKFDLSGVYDRIPFPLSVAGGGFHFENGTIQVSEIQGRIGDSRFNDFSSTVSWQSSPTISISKGWADANVDEIVSWLDEYPAANRIMKDLRASGGRISIESVRLEGPASNPREWRFQSEGNVTDNFSLLLPILPDPIIFHEGRFSMNQDSLDFSSPDASLLDARVQITGTLLHYLTTNRGLDTRIEGELGGVSCQWIHRQAPIPEMCRWRAPITLSPTTLHWRENERLSVSGQATAENGTLVSFDISKTPDSLVIDNLTLQDRTSRATVTLLLDRNLLEIYFSGALNGSSLTALLWKNDLLAGSIEGDFRARYFFSAPLKSTLTGTLQVTGFDANPFGIPLEVAEASLTSDITSCEISTAHFSWKDNEFFTTGRIAQIENGLLLDLDLDTEHLDWVEIKNLIEGARTAKHPRPSFLYGNVRGRCGNFTLNRIMTFKPLKAEFQLNGDRMDIQFHEADACGISFPGKITLTPDMTLFSFEPSAEGQALEPALACLQDGKKFMDGRFDLSGDLTFQLNGTSITESLEGEASLTATDGRIYRAVLLGKIFSLLNIGEILSGEFPDLEEEGFPYKTSTFRGRFKGGQFELETGVIDSSGMKIFYEGSEDLINRQHDLTVVVAPLRTVDSVVEKIPLVNSVFSKGAVIYPVRVRGSWDKPELSLLSPTAVGTEVWGIMVRTLRLPVTLLESIFAGSKKE